jgi:hypothetical protein
MVHDSSQGVFRFFWICLNFITLGFLKYGNAMKKKKKVTIAQGVKVTRGSESKMRKKPGSSNVGKYKTVKKSEFAGASGGSNKYSFPINTLARARNALARAHFAPNPEGIKRKVYAKYPQLAKRAKARRKKA